MIGKRLAGLLALALSLGVVTVAAQAQDKQPIVIGFGMAQTGGLAAGGKSAILAMEIWRDQVNAKGGLLGRPVKLIYYDDQSNPATVPAIYTKLLDVDKVDFIVSGYGTNQIAPAMPVAIQHDRLFFGLFGLAVNSEFHYPRYFSMLPTGPDPKHAFSEPFFKVALAATPKPKKLALLAEDSEFPKNASEGIRDIAKKEGLEIVYDKTYPPGTTDFSPIIRALQAANADLVVACSYPLSSVGILQSANELNFTPKMFGGAMVGLQATVFKDRLKSKLNGIVNYETWVPSPTLMAPAEAFFKTYQARAKSEGVDPLGYYLGGWGYAYLQVLGEAVEGAKSINDDKLADYLHNNEFKSIMGNFRFGKDGEWTKSEMLTVQYHGVTEAANLETWRGMDYQTVLTPTDQKTGDVIYPYAKAK
jgi:branched-chain amino acid transport system substrate-binding protein